MEVYSNVKTDVENWSRNVSAWARACLCTWWLPLFSQKQAKPFLPKPRPRWTFLLDAVAKQILARKC